MAWLSLKCTVLSERYYHRQLQRVGIHLHDILAREKNRLAVAKGQGEGNGSDRKKLEGMKMSDVFWGLSLFCNVGSEPRALCMPGQRSTADRLPQSCLKCFIS